MPLVGGVVVTHGNLAAELVNAAEMIVREVTHITAVTIGWHDTLEEAREQIGQAIARVDQGSGVVVLTDMFGGTPTIGYGRLNGDLWTATVITPAPGAPPLYNFGKTAIALPSSLAEATPPRYMLGAGLDTGGVFISRNRAQSFSSIVPVQVGVNASGQPLYNFPYDNTTDNSVINAFGTATASFAPIIVDRNATTAQGDVAGQLVRPVYTGGTQLWRYDPAPAFKPIPSGSTELPGRFGQWRPVGSQTFAGGISAIAEAGTSYSPLSAGKRLFVGTRD